ncbi:MAG: metallophosphoesterase [Methanobacteriota archaeon]
MSLKILAVADLHGAQFRVNIVLKNIEKYTPDLLVICGDITQFGPGEVAKSFLNQIPVDVLAVPGNIDSGDVGEAISASNIDLRRMVKKGVPFIGVGGTPLYPGADILITVDGGQKPIEEVLNNKSVLVTHVPPYKLQDRVFIGHHAGSKALRALVDACQPRLVLCGHIHEDPGVTKTGGTTVVNCSIGKRTEGALVEIGDSVTVTMLE